MGLSTLLIGPYDGLHTQDKTRVVCGVPLVITKEVFQNTLSVRGAQDKVLARLFHIFYLEFTSPSRQEELHNCNTLHERETVVNNILNHLAKLQSENEQSTHPADTQDPS